MGLHRRRPSERERVIEQRMANVEEDRVHSRVEKWSAAPFAQYVHRQEQKRLDNKSQSASYQSKRQRPQLLVDGYWAVVPFEGAKSSADQTL